MSHRPDWLTTCRGCPAKIVWTKTAAGKNNPIEMTSLTDRDVRLLNEGGVLRFRYGEHVSHFAKCPQAKGFRRGVK